MSKGIITFDKSPVIYVHTGEINMAKSFKGLLEAIQKTLRKKPSENELFVFFNKARTKVKILFYHINGFVIVYKALDNEVFDLEYKNGIKRLRDLNAERLLESLQTNAIIQEKKAK